MTATRPAFSFALALVLIVSLSLKALVLTGTAAAKPEVAWSDIATLLEHQGFQTHYQPAVDHDLTWVSGRAGTCSVQVTEVDPQGWHQSLVAQVAQDNRLLYIFAGEVFSAQPTMRSRIDYYINKLGRYVGMDIRHRPVLALIASPTCENLPLQDLAAL